MEAAGVDRAKLDAAMSKDLGASRDPASLAAARARLELLREDPERIKKYWRGDAEAVTEFERLA